MSPKQMTRQVGGHRPETGPISGASQRNLFLNRPMALVPQDLKSGQPAPAFPSMSRGRSWLAGGMLHDPKDIPVVWRQNIMPLQLANRRCSPGVLPFMDFGMTVHKRDAARPAMIRARKINYRPEDRPIGPAVHTGTPFSIVNAITPFIQEHDGHRRPGIYNLTHSCVLEISTTELVGVAAVKPTKHGHASLPRQELALVRSG